MYPFGPESRTTFEIAPKHLGCFAGIDEGTSAPGIGWDPWKNNRELQPGPTVELMLETAGILHPRQEREYECSHGHRFKSPGGMNANGLNVVDINGHPWCVQCLEKVMVSLGIGMVLERKPEPPPPPKYPLQVGLPAWFPALWIPPPGIFRYDPSKT